MTKTVLLSFFIISTFDFAFSQRKDTLTIELNTDTLKIVLNRQNQNIHSIAALDNYIKEHFERISNPEITFLELVQYNSKNVNRDSLYYLITRKYGIHVYANYNDRY